MWRGAAHRLAAFWPSGVLARQRAASSGVAKRPSLSSFPSRQTHAWKGRAFLPVTCVTPRKPVLPLERGMKRPSASAVVSACSALIGCAYALTTSWYTAPPWTCTIAASTGMLIGSTAPPATGTMAATASGNDELIAVDVATGRRLIASVFCTKSMSLARTEV